MIELDQIGRTQPIWPPHGFNPYLVRILKLEFTPSSCPSLIILPTKPMDPPHGWRPCLLHHAHHHLHHHYHSHPLFLCPLHHRHHHHHHNHHHFHHLASNLHLVSDQFVNRTLPEQTYGEIGDGVVEEEEDDEPIFVLTDEWKEFLAKCEAKRKLEKQQAKKKGKYKQSQG
ncbi:hypothetical protein D8674_027135 [Pyrus ussuriensis x Pyrus communis]|uniref:Uncharacterized protein n=1 Tax=Pyrus ussuriensis x Pyrus communis TaxID=2448454 RepID=A0A5N5IDF1_9ROSA|nr:hypothetical protein D8674_027135 [Pyrus ussuriensis x Pyrus communis]